MSHSTCPNCGESVATPMMLEPPTTCARCCARLHTEGALGGAGVIGLAPDPVDLDLELAAADSAPRIARQEFRSYATHLGERVSSTAELLISELVTNAVLHGPAAAPAVALHCSIAGTTLQVEIADDGNGFVPRAPSEASGNGSGWGLRLVEGLADAWGVDDGKPTRVWFELAIGPASHTRQRRRVR